MSETTNSPSPTQTNELLEDCVTAVPGENGNVPITACNSYYNFDPKFEPAVAMAVLFGLVTACQIVQAIMHRKVRFFCVNTRFYLNLLICLKLGYLLPVWASMANNVDL